MLRHIFLFCIFAASKWITTNSNALEMMNRIYTLFLSLLLYILSQLTVSSQPYCDIRTFSMRDGLSANVISAMGQDDNGLMWFSTYNGLCCYDGYRFTTFRGAEGSDKLSTNRISNIKPDGKLGIWLITHDHRLYFFDTRTCQYVDISSNVEKKTGKPFLAKTVYTSKTNNHTWIVGFETSTCLRVSKESATNPDSLQILTPKELPIIRHIVKKVRTDKAGREWVLTPKGLTIFGTKLSQDGEFEHITEIGGIIYLAQPSGQLWKYSNGASRLQRIPLTPAPKNINCTKQGPDGLLIIGTESDVLAYDPKSGATISLASSVGSVTNINIDQKQRIWAFTENRGIVLIQKNGNALPHQAWQFQQFSSIFFPIASQMTTSAQSLWVEDRQGTVWMVPKNHALCYYDETDGQLHSYPLRPRGYDYEIPFIKKSFIDQQHNIWLTSTQFLTLVNLKYHDIKVLRLQAGQETRSLLAMPDGTIWAGTTDGIIGVYDASGQRKGYIDRSGRISPTPTQIAQKVSALYLDSKGRIYIGTRDEGLFIIENGKTSRYSQDASNPYSLSSNEIYAFDEDERGNLWVATYGGGPNLLQRQADGSVRFIHAGNEMKQYPISAFDQIRRITHDGKGAVILSTTTGLVTFSNRFSKPSDIRFYTTSYQQGDTAALRTCDVLQTLITRKGSVYVTTMGGCIQRLASDKLLQDNLRFYTPKSQTQGNILSLIEDLKGDVWAVRENSLDKFTPGKGLIARFGPNKLGDHIGFTEAQPVINPNSGQLSIPIVGGLIVLQPDELQKNNYKPGIVFTGVQFQGEARPQPLLNKSVLEVPSDKRNITLVFAALDYQDNDLVRYAYKLEGTDKDWNYVGVEHQAQLSHLPAGHHRFIVKSTNSDGVWVDNETTLDIYVHPTFWETIWGKLLMALLAILVIALLIHVILLRHRAKMQRELNKMKAQFFTDVSHKLRTPLTLIGGPVSEVLQESGLSQDVRQHLEMVKRNASRMLVLVNKMLNYSLQHGVYITEADASDDSVPETEELMEAAPAQQPKEEEGTLKLLIVEDNEDLRTFLYTILSHRYTVLLAENGKIGFEKATAEQPDFIITDVTMPEMDGLTMVHQIKQNPDICHIPIVVLSAKASLEDRLQGLKEGIDDYITKPFSATYLRQRIENIIAQRSMLQRTWLGQLGGSENALSDNALYKEETKAEAPQREYRLEAPEIVDTDQQMMEQLMKYLEAHISDQDLKIEDMADAVNLGRTVFYGKIKSIVGMAPFDFLRHIRMQRAEDLISRSQMTISEVAYAVGFTDPKYFTKCFKKETGMTPTEYRDKNGMTANP